MGVVPASWVGQQHTGRWLNISSNSLPDNVRRSVCLQQVLGQSVGPSVCNKFQGCKRISKEEDKAKWDFLGHCNKYKAKNAM